MGGVITNTVQDRGARCRGSVVPPLPDGDGGVTDRATRGACSAGSGIVWRTTSLGLRPPRQHPITPPGLCGVRYILARHTRRSHTDCNPGARAYAHLAGPRHDGGTDWHAHVPQWWPMVLCTLPPHVGKPLPTYVGPAFPGASSCLKHPTDRQACLCRVADRRLVVTGSALLDAPVSLPRWWRVSYAPARPTQDGAGPRRRPSACPRRASAEIPVSQHC